MNMNILGQVRNDITMGLQVFFVVCCELVISAMRAYQVLLHLLSQGFLLCFVDTEMNLGLFKEKEI